MDWIIKVLKFLVPPKIYSSPNGESSLYLTDFLRCSFLHVFSKKKTVRKITSQRSDRSPLVKGGGGRLIMIKKRFQWRRKNEEKKLRLGQKKAKKIFLEQASPFFGSFSMKLFFLQLNAVKVIQGFSC